MIHTIHECDVCKTRVESERRINPELPMFWRYMYIGAVSYLMCHVCIKNYEAIGGK